MMPRLKKSSLSTGIALAALGILALLAYGAYAATPFLKGPALSLEAPEETGAGTTLIRGASARVSTLTLNERDIALAEDGSFSVERAYPPGYTVVEVVGTDRFGRTRTETLTFITKRDYGNEEKGRKDTEADSGNGAEGGEEGQD
jgi:hypothetical protein